MKGSIRRKLITLGLGTVMTATTLVTSTYAWFARNGDAVIDEMKLNLETGSGLQVSLDGTNFSQDITLNMLKPYIKANTGSEYGEKEFKPVTLKHDEAGKVLFDSNGYPLFEKDNVVKIEDEDKTDAEKDNDIISRHKLVDAEQGDYLYFDVYFRLTSNGQRDGNWYLFFQDVREDNGQKTGIVGNKTKVKLNNKLTTMTKSFNANDEIEVNPADAVRLGIVNQSSKKLTVYEENVGLGSAAIEGAVADKNNPAKNAMYTYYNNINPRTPFTSGASACEGFNTESSYSKNYIHKFEDAHGEEYTDVKITFVIWLEGWDADYFAGIAQKGLYNPADFTINMSFKIKGESDLSKNPTPSQSSTTPSQSSSEMTMISNGSNQ